MGLFSRKPDRGLEAELAKQASGARNLLGYALTHKKTNPPAGMEGAALDLTIKENRDAIRDELVRLIREHQLFRLHRVRNRRRVPRPARDDAAESTS
jgi:nitrogen-specific signal transduction histidine kinase